MEAFSEFYQQGLSYTLTFSVWAAVAACLLFLRPIYAYAKAYPLDPDDDGMIGGALVVLILFMTTANLLTWLDPKGDELIGWDEYKEHMNYHPGGPILDILAVFLIPLAIAIMWPGLLLILVTAVPIQYLHVRNAKKREFIERLKGEHLDKGTE